MTQVTKPIMLDETGKQISSQLSSLVSATVAIAEAAKRESIDLSYRDVNGIGLVLRNTANMYVVRMAGSYIFPLVYGNAIKGGEPNPAAYTRLGSTYTADFVNHLGNNIASPYIEANAGCEAVSAGLLFQTNSGMITEVNLLSGADCRYVKFKVAFVPATNGLATLYVKDANGNIMWSWSIWLTTDYLKPETVVNYTNVEYEMMPEAIGTIWDDRENKRGFNPLYQWGRKDIVGLPAAYNSGTPHDLYDINGNTVALSTYGVANDSDAGGTTRTVAHAIKNPDKFFLYYNSTTYNWNNLSWMNNFWDAAMTADGDLSDNQLTAIKTIYDPSPVGFMLPAGRAWTGFTTTGSNTSTAGEFNVVGSFDDGWNFKKNSADAVGTKYYASGYRDNGDGEQYNVGSGGYYWSFAPYSQANARNLNFNSGNVNPLDNNNRANGFSVRPSRALGMSAGSFFCGEMKYEYKDIFRLTTTAYLKAREEERGTPAQLEFELHLERNIRDLAAELYSRAWFPQPLDWFVNLDPTVREVFAPKFRDRVVSHVLFQMISPIFEMYFIFDSYSCRDGKGTLVGIQRLEHHIRSVTDNYRLDAYSLNYDIKAHFMSIIRARLFDIIIAKLEKHQVKYPEAIDYGFAYYLISTFVIYKDPLDGCTYHGNPGLVKLIQPGKSLRDQMPGVGIPIGDVMNQLCSNIYLDEVDQFVKRTLKIRNYVRYVDDGKALHRSYAYLEYCREAIRQFLSESLGLALHPDKTTITSVYDTVFFLGAAIEPHHRLAVDGAVKRFRRAVKEMDEAVASGRYDIANLMSRMNSHLGYFSHFNERKMLDRTLSSAQNLSAIFQYSKDYTKATIKS